MPAVVDDVVVIVQSGSLDVKHTLAASGSGRLHPHCAKQLAIDEEVTVRVPSEMQGRVNLREGERLSHRSASSRRIWAAVRARVANEGGHS
jgi:hypothetical protein